LQTEHCRHIRISTFERLNKFCSVRIGDSIFLKK
jgi:hypothetical protein